MTGTRDQEERQGTELNPCESQKPGELDSMAPHPWRDVAAAASAEEREELPKIPELYYG